jgi:hypothetical protein
MYAGPVIDGEPSPAAEPCGGKPGRVLLVSTEPGPLEGAERLRWRLRPHREAFRTLAPLLARWGEVRQVDHPESRLDLAIQRARLAGLVPLHLIFLPLEYAYLTAQAPNLAFVISGLAELPAGGPGDNPRHNLARIARRLDLALTPSSVTAAAFRRVGGSAEVRVVPVPEWPGPVPAIEVETPPYLAGPVQELARQEPADGPDERWWTEGASRLERLRGLYGQVRPRLRGLYGQARPRLPAPARRALSRAGRFVRARGWLGAALAPSAVGGAMLGGVVYTSFIDPSDPDQDWPALLSAFLLGLGDRSEATLLLVLELPADEQERGQAAVVQRYRELGLEHRCRVLVMAAPVSDDGLARLIVSSTYYVELALASSPSLMLQRFLAAGRPALAPRPGAFGDEVDDQTGFPVESTEEPAAWPNEPGGRVLTWQRRLLWRSLYDQLRASFTVAGTARYAELAARARAQLAERTGPDEVWARLAAALDRALPVSARFG